MKADTDAPNLLLVGCNEWGIGVIIVVPHERSTSLIMIWLQFDQ